MRRGSKGKGIKGLRLPRGQWRGVRNAKEGRRFARRARRALQRGLKGKGQGGARKLEYSRAERLVSPALAFAKASAGQPRAAARKGADLTAVVVRQQPDNEHGRLSPVERRACIGSVAH